MHNRNSIYAASVCISRSQLRIAFAAIHLQGWYVLISQMRGLGKGAKPISPGISNLQIHHLILLLLIDTWNPSFRPEASCNSSKVLLQERRETGKWEEDGKKRRKEIAMKQLSPSLSHSLPQSVVHSHYMERTTNNCPLILWTPQKLLQLASKPDSWRVGAIQQKRRSQTGVEKSIKWLEQKSKLCGS